MDTEGWLIINNRGTMRITRTQSSINWNEISIKLSIKLPDKLFDRPVLSANVTIPKEAAEPIEITTEVIENCKKAIKQTTDLEMNISVIKDEIEDDKR